MAPTPKVRTSPLDSIDRNRMDAIQRLLVNISDPAISARAYALGYDDEEHELGWTTWQKAAGRDRPLTHSVAAAHAAFVATAPAPQKALYVTLDAFENRWFPRMRNAAPRYIPGEHLDTFNAAFFDGLSQQPKGPAVVGSVELYLDRVEQLATMDIPGVTELRASLEKKGLTAQKITQLRALIADARQLAEPPPAPAIGDDVLEAASLEQIEAFRQVSYWYTDWADIFRNELPYNDALRLGVIAPRRTARADTDAEPTPLP